MQGRFFWYDVMTSDTKAAEAFYRRVVGWGAQNADTPGAAYTVFTADGLGVAGLMAMPATVANGAPPCWMVYIAVDDVDAAAAKLTTQGGVIHQPPRDVPGVIRFAVVADPQGAVFLIAKGLAAATMPELPARAPGTIGWRELLTGGDVEAAFAFYEAMFGWTKAEAFDMGPMGTYQLFATGGEPVGGMMMKPPEVPRPFWGVYFNVEGIDAAAERVKAGGGQVLRGPHEVPGGDWIVQCLDPQGAYFALTSPHR